ncbi:MAG: alkaline phosphatase [Paludibacteraceae bacterium]|nr:alkaline phosphatase [Paludibacteraceae bacterium]
MKRTIVFTIYLLAALSLAAQPKYVFYFIGDGMGDVHITAAEMYRAAIQGDTLGRVPTRMTQFPFSGQLTTHSASNAITDSPAAGTCLATGQKINNHAVGVTPKGDSIPTIAEILKNEGWGIGIMTTVAIDHATPASFFAHNANRSNYYPIGKQLCNSRFDFFGGAGFHHPEGKYDNQPVNLYRLAEKQGYTIAHGYQEALRAQQSAQKMILVQSTDDRGAKHGSCFNYVIDRGFDDLTLAQIVQVAIPFLQQRYDRFFMMVEGGMIDYACHEDDGRTAIDEVWDMDEALGYALDFYNEHPDETLIIVTADHETGGMALGNGDYTLHLDLLQHQKCSAWALSDMFNYLFRDNKKPSWQDVQNLWREQLGLWDSIPVTLQEEESLKALYKAVVSGKAKDIETLYQDLNVLADAGVQLLNKKAHLAWTTHNHTAHPVPVFTIGVGAERFSGWHDNTELIPILQSVLHP